MENANVRKYPKQLRGKKRVAQILDAAADILVEAGYDAATTNAIAERAGTSIGSLYQFFPNKETLVLALAEQYRANLQMVLNDVLKAEITREPLPVLIDTIVESIVNFSISNRAFAVLFGPSTPQHLQSVCDPLQLEVLSRVEAILSARSAEMDDDKRTLYATIVVQVFAALQPFICLNGQRNEAMISELKRLLLAYLGPVL